MELIRNARTEIGIDDDNDDYREELFFIATLNLISIDNVRQTIKIKKIFWIKTAEAVKELKNHNVIFIESERNFFEIVFDFPSKNTKKNKTKKAKPVKHFK